MPSLYVSLEFGTLRQQEKRFVWVREFEKKNNNNKSI
jgi:hypothetical protein